MQNSIKLEVCVDNVESIIIADSVGVDRLEVCSALAIGGISPSCGFVKHVKKKTDISLHAMIRTRGGDFCFSSDEISTMLYEIQCFSDIGVDGVVIGFLDKKFNIDFKLTEKFVKLAKQKNLCVTFHRAIDLVSKFNDSIMALIDIGVDRILTSGQADKAVYGIDKIAEANLKFGEKIEIMAGSGISAENVCEIINKTGVKHIHCSASERINKFPGMQLSLGNSASNLEYSITDFNKLMNIKENIELY